MVSRPARARLALAGLALLVFFGLGEILARSFHLVDRLNGFPRRLYVASDDEHLPYRLRPNLDTIARDVHVVINSRGMRGPEIAAAAAPGTHRVLLLGDSVAFGFRLELDDTAAVLLESDLEKKSGQAYEVVNAGVEGYNTENELALLREAGLALHPEAIVVLFNLNDYDYGPVMGPLGVLTTSREQRVSTWSIANLSEFYLLLRWLAVTATSRFRGSPAPPAGPDGAPAQPASAPAASGGEAGGAKVGGFDAFDRYVSALRKQYYRAPSDDRWTTLIDSLRGLRDTARTERIRLLIAILPDGDQIGVATPDLTPQQRLAEVCAQEQLDCLDLRPDFDAAYRRERRRAAVSRHHAPERRRAAHRRARDRRAIARHLLRRAVRRVLKDPPRSGARARKQTTSGDAWLGDAHEGEHADRVDEEPDVHDHGEAERHREHRREHRATTEKKPFTAQHQATYSSPYGVSLRRPSAARAA